MLIFRLVDCVDAGEGPLVDRAGDNGVGVKNKFVDDQAHFRRKQKEGKLCLSR